MRNTQQRDDMRSDFSQGGAEACFRGSERVANRLTYAKTCRPSFGGSRRSETAQRLEMRASTALGGTRRSAACARKYSQLEPLATFKVHG
jgi:hypothetical protein